MDNTHKKKLIKLYPIWGQAIAGLNATYKLNLATYQQPANFSKAANTAIAAINIDHLQQVNSNSQFQISGLARRVKTCEDKIGTLTTGQLDLETKYSNNILEMQPQKGPSNATIMAKLDAVLMELGGLTAGAVTAAQSLQTYKVQTATLFSKRIADVAAANVLLEGKITKAVADLTAFKKLHDAKQADDVLKAILQSPPQPRLENFSNKRAKIEPDGTYEDYADDSDHQRNNQGTPNKNNYQNRYSRSNTDGMGDNRSYGNNNGGGRNAPGNGNDGSNNGNNGCSSNGANEGRGNGNNSNGANEGRGNNGNSNDGANEGRSKLSLQEAIKQGIQATLGDNLFHDVDQSAGKIRFFMNRRNFDKSRLARFLESNMTKKALSSTNDPAYVRNMKKCTEAVEGIYQRSLGN